MRPALLLPALLAPTLALAACANGPAPPGGASAPRPILAAPMDPDATIPPPDDPSGFEEGQPTTGVGSRAPADLD